MVMMVKHSIIKTSKAILKSLSDTLSKMESTAKRVASKKPCEEYRRHPMMEVGTLKSAKQIQEQTQSGTFVAHKKLNQHIQSPNL